ncbi:hypothetical protein KIF24_01875 [Micromonospora sp. Llam7]|uniref:hypothetical protein n=1 Tax=Micromonospora tarapacensis TaxID=2835305 RepID=UPI001C83F0E7|nr:hypothetical protein [Micromonospora tarapacensis]MBX7264922.1 hypothetical protein [Micromonospora tarapacensis]
MTLTTKLAVSLAADLRSDLDLAAASVPLSWLRRVNLDDGTGAGQADRVFHDRRTLAASDSEDLDLAGVLVDALGNAVTFARVKALIVAAAAGNTNTVVVGGADSNAWATWAGADTDTVVVRPGGLLVVATSDATAYPVTAGTGDLLAVANGGSGTPVTYDIVIIGASA